MYKCIALLVLLFLFLPFSQAQQFHWAREVADNTTSLSSHCKEVAYDSSQNCSYIVGQMSRDFIRKVSASGTVLWHQVFGTNTIAEAVTTDHQGNVYVVGTFINLTDLNLDPDSNAVFIVNSPFATNGGQPRDIFVLKMTAAGQFVWGTMIAEMWACEGHAIVVDDNQNVYVAGVLNNVNFVQKLDAQGNLLWKHNLGVCRSRSFLYTTYHPKNLAIEGNHLYISGDYEGTVDMDPSPLSSYFLQSNGDADNFLVKKTLDGTLVWAKSFGNTYREHSKAVDVDAQENVYEVGEYYVRDSVWNNGSYFYFQRGPLNYLRKLSSQGTEVLFLPLEQQNNIKLADLDASQSGYLYASGTAPGAGSGDILIQKRQSRDFSLVWEQIIPSPYLGAGSGVAATPSGELYVVGRYEGIVDFDWASSVFYLRATGRHEGFVLKMGAATIAIPYLQNLEGIQLYPNPAQDWVRIESQEELTEGRLELLSIHGQLLGEFPFDQTHYDLHINNYPAGTYLVRLSSGSKTTTLQLIKSN